MPVLQWSETHVVDRPANMQQNALIFVVPAVALLTPWCKNRSKSSKITLGTCNVSTVGPAARRANSKCINHNKMFIRSFF